MSKKIFTLDQAKTIGKQLGIRWDKFDVEQFRAGLGLSWSMAPLIKRPTSLTMTRC